MCQYKNDNMCCSHQRQESITAGDRVLTAAACSRTGNLLEGPVQQKWMNNEQMHSNCDAEVLSCSVTESSFFLANTKKI